MAGKRRDLNWGGGGLPVPLDPTENPRHFGARNFPRKM
jgi:hypothetical protein